MADSLTAFKSSDFFEGSDPRPTSDLLHVAAQPFLQHYPEMCDGCHDESWNAIVALHLRGTEEILNISLGYCQSTDPRLRALGAIILGQLGAESFQAGQTQKRPSFAAQRMKAITALLQAEPDPYVLAHAACAAGHMLWDDETKDGFELALLRHVSHPELMVRFAVVNALSHARSDASIEALLRMTCDECDDVRDWATFAFVTNTADSAEIRNRLSELLTDTEDNVRYEAVVALAKRRDERARLPLIRRLSDQPEEIWIVDAAIEFLGLGDLDPSPEIDELLAALKVTGQD